MIFPEGTRSSDGRLQRFKHGAFTLAQQARAPVLPIVLQGTSNALPKRGFVLQGRHTISVRVLDEIPYESFAEKPVDVLVEEVRKTIATELGESEAAQARVNCRAFLTRSAIRASPERGFHVASRNPRKRPPLRAPSKCWWIEAPDASWATGRQRCIGRSTVSW